VVAGAPGQSFLIDKLVGSLRFGEGKAMPLDPETGAPLETSRCQPPSSTECSGRGSREELPTTDLPSSTGTPRQGQLPPFGIACAEESPGHRRSQVALVQLTEQDPVQVM